MANVPAKVIIKVESSVEQQENLRNSRKNLKIIQRSAGDKENLVGRSPLSAKGAFPKSKSETRIVEGEIDTKRKKLVSNACQTDSELKQALDKITEEDLITEGEPSEAYWKALAERRRIALDISLKENEELHERVEALEEELNVSRQMLDETKNLVEILTEMLDENNAEKNNDDGGNCSKDLLNASLAVEATESLKDDKIDDNDENINDDDDEDALKYNIENDLKTPIKNIKQQDQIEPGTPDSVED